MISLDPNAPLCEGSQESFILRTTEPCYLELHRLKDGRIQVRVYADPNTEPIDNSPEKLAGYVGGYLTGATSSPWVNECFQRRNCEWCGKSHCWTQAVLEQALLCRVSSPTSWNGAAIERIGPGPIQQMTAQAPMVEVIFTLWATDRSLGKLLKSYYRCASPSEYCQQLYSTSPPPNLLRWLAESEGRWTL